VNATLTRGQTFAAAADLIEADGLNQDGRYYSDETGCYCTLGALAHVRGWTPDGSIWEYLDDDFDVLSKAIAAVLGVSPAGFLATEWSDDADDPATVVATLRAAGELADGLGL
jgi:hypothetical protein